MTFSKRAESSLNPTGQKLLRLMDLKQTNLACSADVSSTKELLALAEKVGPEICLLKTHVDILEDFTQDTPKQLLQLAEKHNFLLFEDRKFADIGSTVRWQYLGGIYHIADWADITNAHLTAGPGTIEGLKEGGLPRGRGLLLLAQMSSQGSLNQPKKAEKWAREHEEFVIGFICREKISSHPPFLHMTPGVGRKAGKGLLRQQYITAQSAIEEGGSDVIIVGRGIYEAISPQKEAAIYRQEAWDSYKKRIQFSN